MPIQNNWRVWCNTEAAYVMDPRTADLAEPTVCPNEAGAITAVRTVIVSQEMVLGTADPTVNDDIERDYKVGDKWTNGTNGREWLCIDNTDGAAIWQSVETPYADVVSADTDITTSSMTHIPATDMALTPPAGTYMVSFSASVSHAAANKSTYIQIAIDGALQGVETRFRRGGGQGNVAGGLAAKVKVTVNGAQVVEGCWRSETISTAEMGSRSLSIVEVT